MEKYIKKKDLGEVMAKIAAVAIENTDKLKVEVSIRDIVGPEVQVIVYGKNYERIAEQNYRLVPDGMSADEIAEETVMTALAKLGTSETPSNDK
jgi:hypothetical protein